ncbi:MAG: [protein-PII] uridylyltransferase [Thermodesulfobacteriota bacterium]
MTETPSQAASTLDSARKALFEAPRPDLCLQLSRLFDDYFLSRPGELTHGRTPFAIAAVGGYGRQELCPRSDIDVLIIYEKKVPAEAKALAQAIFFPLWDLGADLGHGVRSIKECLSLARDDWQVFASLIDARFLAGSRAVFGDFVKLRDKKLLAGRSGEFKAWLTVHNGRRAASYGDASGMLEPSLKEGLGGLRDIHQLRWLSHLDGREGGGLPAQWLELLDRHLQFLLSVRNHLHLLENRKEDRLSLDAQLRLAPLLGFADDGQIKGVEAFLTELHRVMAEIRILHRSLWPMLGGRPGRSVPPRPLGGRVALTRDGLDFDAASGGKARPEDVLDIFGHALRLGEPLTLDARHAIEAGLKDFESFAATGEGGAKAFQLLEKALLDPHGGAALSDMLETGVLGAIIPEFGRVQHMVQYDVFHIHPVGRHTVETILELKKAALPDHPLHEVFARLPHPERLMLGAIFHDIGKGLGGGHSEKGADIAREALERLGVSGEAVSDVSFLVLRHLLLADVAMRRDISDRDVLAACARRVGTSERLDMLLLLTMADSVATGPSAWNDWKASLIGGLHRRILSVLEGGALFGPGDAQAMMALRDTLRAKAGGMFGQERMEACLDAMPARYLLSRDAQDILSDMKLVSELEEALEEDFRMRPSSVAGRGVAVIETVPAKAGDGWGVTLAARHQPALFATMAGVLALHGVNIRSADFFLWEDGTEIHHYQTAEPPAFLDKEELWARVRRAVRYALTGKLSLDYRIQEKRSSPLAVRQPDMGIRPSVTVDNDASEYFTVVEVRAADRLGLLYDIAVALDSLGLDVHIAKIDTHGLEVFDMFYVRGAKGRKVEGGQMIGDITRIVLASLA